MHSKPHGRQGFMLPLGLSILVNGVLFVFAAKVLTAPPAQDEVIIAVELKQSRPVEIISKPMPVAPDPVKPVQAPPVRKPITPEPVRRPKPNPITNIVKNVLPPRPQPAIQSKPAPIPARPMPAPTRRPGNPFRINRPTVVFPGPPSGGGSGGGGTSATGPGAYAGPGSGTGTQGNGEGSGFGGSGHGSGSGTGSGHGEGHGTTAAIQPPPPPPPHPPPPQPKEEPKPKGESRGPQIARQSKPLYPPDARDDGVEGTVTLLLTINKSGDVSKIKLEKGSGDRRLDKAAEQTVRRWSYNPSLRDGEPIEAAIRVRVQFKLE